MNYCNKEYEEYFWFQWKIFSDFTSKWLSPTLYRNVLLYFLPDQYSVIAKRGCSKLFSECPEWCKKLSQNFFYWILTIEKVGLETKFLARLIYTLGVLSKIEKGVFWYDWLWLDLCLFLCLSVKTFHLKLCNSPRSTKLSLDY